MAPKISVFESRMGQYGIDIRFQLHAIRWLRKYQFLNPEWDSTQTLNQDEVSCLDIDLVHLMYFLNLLLAT
jgi:hypothetical protein